MPKYIVQMRRGTSSQWANSDIVPLAGELVVEIDTENNLHKLKIGDGVHAYADLAYLMAGDEIVTQVLAQAKPRVVTVELTTNWTKDNDDKYSQIITIADLTSHSRLDLQPTADMLAEFKQLGLVFVTENNGGTITVYSVGNMPLKAYTMQATIIETECNGDTCVVGATIGTPAAQADWAQTEESHADYIKNKPVLGAMAAKDEVAKTDLAADVQASLDKAGSALQSYTETDPTVPAWAKESTKPKYTADEVGAVAYTAQTLTEAQKAQVRSNIGAGASSFSGSYNDLTNKPDLLALGETSSTAYYGDKGKAAYDHSQLTGNPHGVKASDIGLGNVENKSSAEIRGELTKADVTTALGYTPPESDTVYTHPDTHPATMITGLSTVATSGKYDDLTDKPTLGKLASKDSVAKTDLASDVQASLDKADGALPNTTFIPVTLSDLTDDENHRTVTDAEKAAWNNNTGGASDYSDLTNKPIIVGEGENSLIANDLENNIASGANAVALGSNTMAVGPNTWATGTNTVAGAKGYYYSAIDLTNKKIYVTDTQVTPVIGTPESTKAIDIGIPVGALLSIDNYYKYEDCATVSAVDSANGIITYTGDLPFTEIQVPENIKYNDFVVRSTEHPNVGLTAVGENAFAFGNGAVSSGEGSYSEGYLTEARGDYCHAEGREGKAIGNASHVEGRNNTAIGYASHAQGQDNTVTGTEAHVGGRYSNSLAPYSFVHGYKSTVTETGNKSFAGGNEVTVSGENSFGFGSNNTVSGKGVGVFGYNHTVSGNRAFAVGQDNTASGIRSFVAGESNEAIGEYSTVVGYDNAVTSTGKKSFAGGTGTTVSGENSFGFGNTNTVTGSGAVALGQGCQALDNRAVAMGQNCISQGMRTVALGEGLTTHTNSGQKGQFVAGRYNEDAANALFVVGRGSSDTDRRNAFEVICEKHSGTKTEVSLKVGDTTVTETQLANMGSGGMDYTYGTEDLVAGTSELATGSLYFVYE